MDEMKYKERQDKLVARDQIGRLPLSSSAMSTVMICSRTACRVELKNWYVMIWNDPSRTEPNVYCLKCGNKIVYQNPSLKSQLTRGGT